MQLEFNGPNMDAISDLKTGHMNGFYETMKKAVWNIRVLGEVEEAFLTGVCIKDNGLILTVYFDSNDSTPIHVWDPDEKQYFVADFVWNDKSAGLALVRAKHKNGSDHVKFAEQTRFPVGQNLYAIIPAKEASSSAFLIGMLAYPYDPNSAIDNKYSPKYRRVKYLRPNSYPDGLGQDVSLLQISKLGALWLYEGRGAPVFNAVGHLSGLVAFQVGGFDMAIHVDIVREFLSRYEKSSV